MKAIQRSKRTEASKEELGLIRQSLTVQMALGKVGNSMIVGPDFVAIELTDKTTGLKGQGCSVLHWRDKFDLDKGKSIALGRAQLRLAIAIANSGQKS